MAYIGWWNQSGEVCCCARNLSWILWSKMPRLPLATSTPQHIPTSSSPPSSLPHDLASSNFMFQFLLHLNFHCSFFTCVPDHISSPQQCHQSISFLSWRKTWPSHFHNILTMVMVFVYLICELPQLMIENTVKVQQRLSTTLICFHCDPWGSHNN